MHVENFVTGLIFLLAAFFVFKFSIKGKGEFHNIKSWWMPKASEEDVRFYNRAVGVFVSLILFFVGTLLLLTSLLSK